MNAIKLTNYELTIEQIDNYIRLWTEEDPATLNLEDCKIALRIVDMIQATIANTDILKQDFSYYSAALNHYASIVRERMYHIIRNGG